VCGGEELGWGEVRAREKGGWWWCSPDPDPEAPDPELTGKREVLRTCGLPGRLEGGGGGGGESKKERGMEEGEGEGVV
jgi:hypothetical protein